MDALLSEELCCSYKGKSSGERNRVQAKQFVHPLISCSKTAQLNSSIAMQIKAGQESKLSILQLVSAGLLVYLSWHSHCTLNIEVAKTTSENLRRFSC
jgi:hypothetical protein